MTNPETIAQNLTTLGEVYGGLEPKIRRASSEIGNSSIGAILDEFSMQCFEPEVTIWPISPRDTSMALDMLKPEFMLVESAWNGNDGDWQFQITSPSGPKDSFFNLIHELRSRQIPSVFWNKEDPPHFEEFLPAARAVDYIFTCEESLVPTYNEVAGHDRVNVLRFAAQPSIHTPIRSSDARVGNVAFAGQYFAHKFPERREQMHMLFPAAEKLGLSIYSRALHGDPNYAFPDPYAGSVVGSLKYAEMIQAYRNHKVFLNVNSVPNSKSMCARRIFELSASKTVVVSAPTEAISSSYESDEVFMAGTPKEAEGVLTRLVNDNIFRERAAHKAWRRTLSEHTYANRLSEIRRVIGLEDTEYESSISAVCIVSSLSSLERLLREISNQTLAINELSVILRKEISRSESKELLNFIHRVSSDKMMVGKVDSIDKVSFNSPWLTVFSEAYEYGPNYVNDMRLYQKHLPVPGVVAKGTTMSAIKGEDQYIGNVWPEDILTRSFLSGAWLVSQDTSWQEFVFHESKFPGELYTTTQEVNVSDRFNIREFGQISSNDWRV